MNDFFCAHNLNFNLRGIERIAVEESECDAQQALSLLLWAEAQATAKH